MYDNITMERVWQDEDFFEVSVTCTAQTITAITRVYLTDVKIDELSNVIKDFLNGNVGEYHWESGVKGDSTTSSISFDFIRIDLWDHIQIEAYMEIDDGGLLSKHNCCFYIKTEYGLLNNFCKNIVKIKDKHIGVKVMLNEKL